MSFFHTVSGLISSVTGITRRVAVRNTGELAVEVAGSNAGPFGQLLVSQPTQVLSAAAQYGLNNQVMVSSTANGATVDTNSNRFRIQTGTTNGASGILQSVRPIAYRAGIGNHAIFTPVFTAGIANSSQIVGVGNAVDGYFFGFNGTALGIMHRSNSSDSWTAQTSWNGDRVDGAAGANNPSGVTWDPTKGSPVMIVYPFLGYGPIRFYILNPNDSSWILVHTIRYANTSTAVEVTNPALFFWAQAISTGSTTNLTIYIGSVGVFIDGPREFVGPQFSLDNTKAGVTTETNVFTLQSATSYNGTTSRAICRIRSISASSDGGNASWIMRLTKGTTLGGVPSYAGVDGSASAGGATITGGNSVVTYDTAGTTLTGGTRIFAMSGARNTNFALDVTSMGIYLLPGEKLTLSMFSGAAAGVTGSINWQEDH